MDPKTQFQLHDILVRHVPLLDAIDLWQDYALDESRKVSIDDAFLQAVTEDTGEEAITQTYLADVAMEQERIRNGLLKPSEISVILGGLTGSEKGDPNAKKPDHLQREQWREDKQSRLSQEKQKGN